MKRPRIPTRVPFLLLVLVLLPSATALRTSLPRATVPRLDARTLASQQALDALISAGPCLLSHAFDKDPGTRKMSDEAFSDTFFKDFQDVEVEVQVNKNARGARPTFYAGSLEGIVDGMMEKSTHDEAWYLLSENLLENARDPAMKEPLVLPPSLFGAFDYFDLFPPKVRPKKHCLILGGTGARSFLHADPFEWTGVNYLMEGQKLWTFIPPSVPRAALALERVKPDAWADDVSSGWKSASHDLYHTPPYLSSSTVALDLPLELQNVEGVQAVVQSEGEMVVIPPGWAHQVYHLQPSLCLAWQVCNEGNFKCVIRHMLTWAAERKKIEKQQWRRRRKKGEGQEGEGEGGREGGEKVDVMGLVEAIWKEHEGREGEEERGRVMATIERAIKAAMVLRHGPQKAKEVYKGLWEMNE